MLPPAPPRAALPPAPPVPPCPRAAAALATRVFAAVAARLLVTRLRGAGARAQRGRGSPEPKKKSFSWVAHYCLPPAVSKGRASEGPTATGWSPPSDEEFRATSAERAVSLGWRETPMQNHARFSRKPATISAVWLVAALGADLAGSGCRGEGADPRGGALNEPVGQMQARLVVADETPIGRVRIEVREGERVVETRDLGAADHRAAGAGDGARGRRLLRAQAGAYSATATALDEAGAPVEDCARATASARVAQGQTSEVMLGILWRSRLGRARHGGHGLDRAAHHRPQLRSEQAHHHLRAGEGHGQRHLLRRRRPRLRLGGGPRRRPRPATNCSRAAPRRPSPPRPRARSACRSA